MLFRRHCILQFFSYLLLSHYAAAGKSAEDVAKEIEQRHRDIGYGEREEEAEDALASVAAGERDIVERQVRHATVA